MEKIAYLDLYTCCKYSDSLILSVLLKERRSFFEKQKINGQGFGTDCNMADHGGNGADPYGRLFGTASEALCRG